MIALFNWSFYKGQFWRRYATTTALAVPAKDYLFDGGTEVASHVTVDAGTTILVRLSDGLLCVPSGDSNHSLSQKGLLSLIGAGTLVPWTQRHRAVPRLEAAPKRFPCTPSEQTDLNSLYADAPSISILSCNPDLYGTGTCAGDPEESLVEDYLFDPEDPAFSDSTFTQHHHRLATDFLEAVASAEAQEHECLCVDVPRDRLLGFVDRTAKEVHLVPMTTWIAYKHWCLHMEGKLDPRWENWGQKYRDSKYNSVEVSFSEPTPARAEA